MNKSIFYTGIGMLVVPFILALLGTGIFWLVNSGINFLAVLIGFCFISYIGTAVWLIVRGVKE